VVIEHDTFVMNRHPFVIAAVTLAMMKLGNDEATYKCHRHDRITQT